jgi:hypothetical protein
VVLPTPLPVTSISIYIPFAIAAAEHVQPRMVMASRRAGARESEVLLSSA